MAMRISLREGREVELARTEGAYAAAYAAGMSRLVKTWFERENDEEEEIEW